MKHLLVFLAVIFVCASLDVHAGVPRIFSADFTQTRSLPGFDAPLVSHGRMRFDRDGTLHWTVNEPYHYEFIMHNGTAHEVLPDGSERDLDTAEAPWLAIIQRVLHAALTEDLNTLSAYFRIKRVPGRLVLTPLASALKSHIDRIEVVQNAAPEQITIAEHDGGKVEIRFEPIGPRQPKS